MHLPCGLDAERMETRTHSQAALQCGRPSPLWAGQPVTSWERIPGVTPDEKLVHHTRRATWAIARTLLSQGSGAALHSSECLAASSLGGSAVLRRPGVDAGQTAKRGGLSRRHPACLGRSGPAPRLPPAGSSPQRSVGAGEAFLHQKGIREMGDGNAPPPAPNANPG